MSSEDQFENIFKECKDDPKVIGLVLGGSRGKNMHTEYSDYDFTIIIVPEAKVEYEKRVNSLKKDFDVAVSTLVEFKKYAQWGSELMWDRYNFTHVKASIDKTGGEIQDIIDQKGKVPPEYCTEFISASLDEYINQVYRSIKCLRDKNDIGYRLEAATSIKPLLNCLFAIHDNRICPYFKYLYWELTEFPLVKLPLTPNELIEKILSILESGDYKIQQEIFRLVEKIFRAEGYGRVFDSWKGDDQWIMNYIP
ncbi:MAG: hypothetical protein EAX86_04745 [Candidatus Heimdallarchaeota archaeon]|nr:hypothetical protein [Candidatus Heimdallarchaeota archaeon]